MDKDRKQQYVIKFCCIIAAFGLWLYISNIQNVIKTVKINVPVQLINTDAVTQSKFTILPFQEHMVTLSIRGNNTDLYLVKPEQFKVVADLSAYALKKGDINIAVDIKISPENINIVKEALWVTVKIDDLLERTVPIKIETTGKAKEGFTDFTPIPKPTAANISGAAEYVNAVKYVVAKADITNAESELTLNLPVKAVDAVGRTVEEVKIQQGSTEVVIPVKKVKKVGINIKTTGQLNKEVVLGALTPSADKIDIAGEEAVLNGITALDTESIDLASLDISKSTVEAKLIVPKDVVLIKSNSSITVKLTMDKVIQKNILVTVQYTNLNDAYEVTLESDKISLVLSGPENALNLLSNESLICSMDFDSLNEGEHELPVITKLPDTITKVSVNPQKIKVTLKKKVKV